MVGRELDRRGVIRLLVLAAAAGVLLASTALITRGGRITPVRAVTGVFHFTLLQPVVDVRHHLLYGIGDGGVATFNELTGRGRLLTRFSRYDQLEWVALDPSNNHLVVAAAHLDHIYKHPSPGYASATSRAYVIDAATGRVIRYVAIGYFPVYAYFPFSGSADVDPLVHHGLVTDAIGRGVMVDTGTGRLLARFFSGDDFTFGFHRASVIDPLVHRLFIGLFESANKSKRALGTDLVVVNTVSGQVVRRLFKRVGPTVDVALDQRREVVYWQTHGTLFALNARSDAVLWRHANSEPEIMLDDPVTKKLFVESFEISLPTCLVLDVIDATSGKNIRQLSLSSCSGNGGPSIGPAFGAVDEASGRVLLDVDANPVLDEYDARSGAFLGDVSIVAGGYGSVVDPVTHRIFLSSVGAFQVIDSCAGGCSTL